MFLWKQHELISENLSHLQSSGEQGSPGLNWSEWEGEDSQTLTVFDNLRKTWLSPDKDGTKNLLSNSEPDDSK